MPSQEDRRVATSDTLQVRELITGYMPARALLAADELGLVDLLREGAKDVEEIAQATGTHAPTLYRFMRALASLGLLTEEGDDRFALGPLAPGLREAARIGVESYRAWEKLLYTLQTGKPAFPRLYGKGLYEYLAENPARAERFDSALAAVSRDWAPAVMEAYSFAGFPMTADIGGGQGTFIAELLKAHPDMHGVLFDLPHVLEHAGPVLEAAGVAHRCRVAGGSFFDAVPPGADAYTLCNLLTDWDDDRGRAILANCRHAMAEGGKVLVIDRVVPPSGEPNRQAMAFLDLFFLVFEGGGIRTEEGFRSLFASAGLRLTRIVPTASTFSVVEGVPV